MKQRDTILRYSAACFLLLLPLIVYIPALQNGFVNWDDNFYIYENRDIRNIGLELIRWSFSSFEGGSWHPLVWFSLALDYALWGLDPKGFHLTNIILHSLNTVLVFILAMRLIVEGSRVQGVKFEPSTPVLSAAIAALLFGIHPMHVESVAWATERKDVLSLFFFLITLLSYVKYNVSQRRVYYVTTLLLFTAAVMSKPMVVTLPLVLLILDFYPFRRFEKDGRRVFIEKLPFFLLSLILSLLTMSSAWSAGSVGSKHAFITRLFISARGYIFYLVKLVFPINLAPIYPYPAKVNILTFEYLGSAILILSITIYSLWTMKRGRLIFSVWMYYIITLLPVIGIVHTGQQDTADRYTYMPSIGPFLLAGLVAGYIIERKSKRLLPVAAALLILSGPLIYKTVEQIGIWRDPVTLWTREVSLFPDAAIGHICLGEAYSDSGDYQLALRELNKAIELDISIAQAYIIRGTVYYKLGNYQLAISNINKAIELNTQDAYVYGSRGNAYYALGDYEKAINDYSQAIGLNPRYADPYNNRGYIYYEIGESPQSLSDLKNAVLIDPEFAEAYFNLGLVYSRLGDVEQASLYFNRAAELGLEKAGDEARRLLSSKGGH